MLRRLNAVSRRLNAVSRRLAAVLILLSAACVRPPVSDEVVVEIERNDRARVTVETTFHDAELTTSDRLAFVEAARVAAMHGNDPWSARFLRVTPEDEEVTIAKHRGKVERVTRSIRIPAIELQQVFSDTNITVSLLSGDGWNELRFIPGGSGRATREQRKHFEDVLESWSGAVSRYFAALDHLYLYMDANAHRAAPLFRELMNATPREVDVTPLLEDEVLLVEAVRITMDDIAKRMDEEQDNAWRFAEEADLIYNAFPARTMLRVPGDVISREGFEKELAIEPVDLLEIITKLEGRWMSPDPLVLLLREQKASAETLASAQRTRNTASPKEIADAIREQLERPKVYAVRWR
jgi:hypothetical protein